MELTPRPGVRQNVPPGPVDPTPIPSPSRVATLASWVPLALAIAGLIVQQSLIALRLLPQSEPVAIALVILGAVGAILAALPPLLATYTAHVERLEAMRAQTTLAISGPRKAG